MSLIHEALRKARREAAREDDPGVIYPGGLTGQRRQRSLAVGIIVGAALTIGVAAVVGGSLWWVIRERPPGGSAEARPDSSPAQPIGQGETDDGRVDEISIGVPEPRVATEPSPRAIADPPERLPTPIAKLPAVAEQRPSDPASRTVTFATPTQLPESATAKREYVAEADLGYASLSLDYIVFRSTDPFAQINGVEVRVGSTIQGFKVEEITADAIRLRDARGPLVLRAE